MRCLAVLAGGVVTALAALFAIVQAGQASHSINSTAHYSFKTNQCATADRVDPVTVVFWNLATTDRVNQNINQHTDLDHGATPVGAQHFSTGGQCLGQTVDKSSCSYWTCTRWHIRGRLAASSHPTYGTTTQATPHHEDWIDYPGSGCFPGNHAVDKGGVQTGGSSGFSQGREHLFNGFFAAGHVIETWYWGNTIEFPQCDGDMAGSDGFVDHIKISHGH